MRISEGRGPPLQEHRAERGAQRQASWHSDLIVGGHCFAPRRTMGAPQEPGGRVARLLEPPPALAAVGWLAGLGCSRRGPRFLPAAAAGLVSLGHCHPPGSLLPSLRVCLSNPNLKLDSRPGNRRGWISLISSVWAAADPGNSEDRGGGINHHVNIFDDRKIFQTSYTKQG